MLHLRFAGARQVREFADLGPVVERRGAQIGQRPGGGGDFGGHFRVLERCVERPVEQEIEITARLRRERSPPRATAASLQQFGAGAQHLVLGDLAVAEQRFVDAQVFVEQ